MNNTELAWSLVTAPGAAFSELRARPRFLFPLLVLAVSTAVVLAWYYGIVDLPWFIDQTFSSNPRLSQMTGQQREQAMGAMSRSLFLWSSVIGGTVGLVFVRCAEAVYYLLAGKVTNVQFSFHHWLSLSCWSSLPQIVGIVTMALYLAMAGTTQISASELSVLSLNELFLQIPPGGKGFTLASSLTLLQPWTWALTIVGVHAWSGRNWPFATIFVLLPVIVVYGSWALFALL